MPTFETLEHHYDILPLPASSVPRGAQPPDIPHFNQCSPGENAPGEHIVIQSKSSSYPPQVSLFHHILRADGFIRPILALQNHRAAFQHLYRMPLADGDIQRHALTAGLQVDAPTKISNLPSHYYIKYHFYDSPQPNIFKVWPRSSFTSRSASFHLVRIFVYAINTRKA